MIPPFQSKQTRTSAVFQSFKPSLWIILILLVVATADGRLPTSPDSFRGTASITDSNRTTIEVTNETEQEPKPSFLTVDPSKVLSTLVNHAGLLIPDSVEKDLKILSEVCSAGLAELDILARRLIVRNFTVSSVEGDRHTLRVGKLQLRWDSYLKPCFEIEVEDVHFLVEFTNLVLTRNNWHELQDQGLFNKSSDNSEKPDDSDDNSELFRIGSLNFSGNLTAEIRSRPLDTHIHVLTFDLDSLEDFNNRIREAATTNAVENDRRGVTKDELGEMLKVYFRDKVKDFLSSCLHDFTHNPVTESKFVQDVQQSFKEASDTIMNYTTLASSHKRERFQKIVSAKLDKWGLTIPADEFWVHASRLNSNIWGFTNDRWEELRVAFVTADTKMNEFWENQRELDDRPKEILFPDW